MTSPGRANSDVDRDADQDTSDEVTALQKRISRRALGCLLGLVLLVNLSMSLYQLPLNRVIERRLCRDYYSTREPPSYDPDGDISENLCKVDDVQRELAWIQGAMETAWIVGGLYYSGRLHANTPI